jgi:hypothetical protein
MKSKKCRTKCKINLGDYTIYNCIAGRKNTYYSLVILIVNAESMRINFSLQKGPLVFARFRFAESLQKVKQSRYTPWRRLGGEEV